MMKAKTPIALKLLEEVEDTLTPMAIKGEELDNGQQHDWKGSWLEGDPPNFFKGDYNKTIDFLITLKQFMIMN